MSPQVTGCHPNENQHALQKSRPGLLMHCATLLLPALSVTVFAQETTPTESSSPVEQLEAVDGANAGDIVDQSVSNTLTTMDRIEARLRSKRTGNETQDLQRRVLKDLDAMIDMARQQAEQQQQQQQQNQQRQQNQQQQRGQQNSQDGQQPQQQPGGQRQGSGADQAGQRSSSNQLDSTAAIEQGTAAAAELAQRRVVIRQIWGHLPARLREQVLNQSDEKFLPQYEDLIREYFRALAEKSNDASPAQSRTSR